MLFIAVGNSQKFHIVTTNLNTIEPTVLFESISNAGH